MSGVNLRAYAFFMDALHLASLDEPMTFALDVEDLDTDLDTMPWSHMRAFAERSELQFIAESVRARHVTLAREIDRVMESSDTVVPPCLGSLALLGGALGNVAAFADSTIHRELFCKEGMLSPYLSAVYIALHDVLEHLHPPVGDHEAREARSLASRFDKAMLEQHRLDRVCGILPPDVSAAVLEAFVALSRFTDDVA